MGKGLITWLVAVLIILVMLPACGGAAELSGQAAYLMDPYSGRVFLKRTAKRRCQ